jgi:putative salt-induced outer membrane protein YdiY
MRYRISIVVACLLLFTQISDADEIHMKNGDRISGKIKQLVDGKLTIESDIAGKVTVSLSDIQTLSSDEPIEVNLKDETGFKQKISSAEPGRFAIEGGETTKAQEFVVADIVSINPPKPKWKGDIAVGITSTHGNTKTEMVSANANFSKRTEKDRTTLSTDYAKGEQEDPDTGEDVTIEDWWRIKGKYDYFFNKKLYAYVDGRYEKDAVADLDRRVIVGAGGGYQWIESEKMNFSTELGLASLYEKYDDGTDSNSDITLQAGYNFDRKLLDNINFVHDLTFYPRIDKFSDYYLTTTTGLRADFTKEFFMTFKAILNYDRTPAVGAHRTDVKYFFGLGYRF